jgi:hypothetical protein
VRGKLIGARCLDVQLSEKQRKKAEAEGDRIVPITKTFTNALQNEVRAVVVNRKGEE